MNQEPANLEAEVGHAWPPAEWRDVHVVLAVSGGADSVAMLRSVAKVKEREDGAGRVYVAHLNHGSRGTEAEADQDWLASLCDRHKLPLELGRADVPALAREQGDGWEAAARLARYEFLVRVAERLGARWVAVAHTADDQVETVLHRISRGSGLAGLSGMPRVRALSPTVSLVRPLLAVWRRDVLDYLTDLRQDFRTDASNFDPRYTRNRLRQELLPELRANYNADVDGALLRLARQASEMQDLVVATIAPLMHECVSTESDSKSDSSGRNNYHHPACRTKIDCRPLVGKSAVLIRELCKAAWSHAGWPLQAMGFEEWQKLAEMAAGNSATSTVVLPGSVRASREGLLLVLQRQTAE